MTNWEMVVWLGGVLRSILPASASVPVLTGQRCTPHPFGVPPCSGLLAVAYEHDASRIVSNRSHFFMIPLQYFVVD